MFNTRLKEARQNAGLTQEQLAAQIGVAKTTVTGYEKGNSEPDMEKIEKIMKVLNVDANFLWQDEMQRNGDSHFVLSQKETGLIKMYRNLDNASREFIEYAVSYAMQRSKPVETTQPVEGKRKRLSPEQLAERAEQERGIGKTENAPQ